MESFDSDDSSGTGTVVWRERGGEKKGGKDGTSTSFSTKFRTLAVVPNASKLISRVVGGQPSDARVAPVWLQGVRAAVHSLAHPKLWIAH